MTSWTCIIGVLVFCTTLSSVTCGTKDKSKNKPLVDRSYGYGSLWYYSPKYFSYCSVVTTKKVINGVERYFVSHEYRNTVTLANNITVAGSFLSPKGIPYKVEHKLCDYLRQDWLQTFAKLYHAPIQCPFKPTTIIWRDLEIPPKQGLVPMVPGTYKLLTELYHTVSKERVVVINYTIHFGSIKKNKNKKG